MNELLTLGAGLSAGISVSCILYLIFRTLFSLEVSKAERFELTEKKLPAMIRLVLPLAPNMKKLIQSDNMSATIKDTRSKLQMAGYDSVISAEEFIAAKYLLVIAAALFSLLFLFGGKPMFAMIVVFMAFLYPSAWLRKVIAKRHKSIMRALPNMLDLLTLSVEAGKDFLSALREILEHRKADDLGEELMRALQEIQLGKKRQTALKEMAQRVQQPELVSVVNSIVQADELGISIGQLLKLQSDQLRAKRFSLAEKLANETPVKILFPVVLFIFPSVIIILMGPILMQAGKMFGN